MKIYTKDKLIKKLLEIRDMGWIPNARPGNQGGVGNTLEDLLGIEENNLPLPNASEWELKTQRANQSSLTTLFHMEPSPRALKFVPSILLSKYGWKHDEAGKRYPENEMSFRQTINAVSRTDRGFGIIIEYNERKILVSFDYAYVNLNKHGEWIGSVKERVGLGELNPQPYWGFDDLYHKAAIKLLNCFYIKADVKKIDKKEYYHYREVYMLETFDFDKFIDALAKGVILIDFDARTGHNHGTKFRMRQDRLPDLYKKVTVIAK